jgi:hypothetical protein
MNKFRIHGYGGKTAATLVTLEDAMADWRRVACTAQAAVNPDYVRTVCDEIVNRARMLSTTSKLNFPEVAGFLLTRSRAWILGGLPINQIGAKMPKTLGDLGLMKIAEGGVNGEPLPVEDLKSAMARPQHRIIQ